MATGKTSDSSKSSTGEAASTGTVEVTLVEYGTVRSAKMKDLMRDMVHEGPIHDAFCTECRVWEKR
jgi:hypothetical protein